MKKKKNNQKDIIIQQKRHLRKFIDYLVDSYYMNPNKKISIIKIKKQLKIKNCKIIDEFIYNLEEKEYIERKCNFLTINRDGFTYLESIHNHNREYENSIMSVIISWIAFIISSITLICSNIIYLYNNKNFNYSIMFWGIAILVITIILLLSKTINEILEKLYY